MRADSLVVLDFETTGLSPDMGDRAIEVGAVRLERGEVVDSFQELMNPGFRVSDFIANYTGIDNTMLAQADDCDAVMGRFSEYIGDANLIAHNASFDKKFLDAELDRINVGYGGEFSCSLLLARRIFQGSPNHKLAQLVSYAGIESGGGYHRALYDAEMTAKVWMAMLQDITQRFGVSDLSFEQIKKINKTQKKSVDKLLSTW
ncbi:MAG: 3'-5' exonuclease [Agarilytica sp.]